MINWFFALSKIPKLISLGVLIFVVLSALIFKQCKEVKDAKGIKEKQVKIHQEKQEDTKEKVEVSNELQKEKNRAIDEVKELPAEEIPPTDEELEDIRKKVGDRFRQGLPK